ILVPGVDLASSERAVELAETHPELFAAVGVHPHYAASYGPETRARLRRLAESPDRSPRSDQRRAFADQLDLAGELGLPAVIHNREAGDDLLQQALPWAAARDNPGVLHAFSSDEATAAAAAQAGFFLGVAGPITFPNAEGRRIITGGLPPDRVVLETDAPYLSPHPRRGERNEPARVALIAEVLSGIWQRRPDETRRITWDNAATLFDWNHGTDHDHLL
ncbi:MAG: yabD, partial [Anaerolineales bacterium]|nr:yabD [Anaerolineales bacterium]